MAKISTINTNNIDISKTETLVNTSNTDNIYSINNFISDGYKFVETYKTSSGESRSVYFKEI